MGAKGTYNLPKCEQLNLQHFFNRKKTHLENELKFPIKQTHVSFLPSFPTVTDLHIEGAHRHHLSWIIQEVV